MQCTIFDARSSVTAVAQVLDAQARSARERDVSVREKDDSEFESFKALQSGLKGPREANNLDKRSRVGQAHGVDFSGCSSPVPQGS